MRYFRSIDWKLSIRPIIILTYEGSDSNFAPPMSLTDGFPETYKVIDLFAGCGGFTLGFTEVETSQGEAAFEPVWANDFNEDAVASYNANFGKHCRTGDIVSILEEESTEIPNADVVIGGPPCQGFSLLNKKREGDPRKQLWIPFMDVLEKSGARLFVMENVPQLLNSRQHDAIRETAGDLGFETTSAKLCAADYGVPQTRWRAFIFGVRGGNPTRFFPPPKTHRNPEEVDQLEVFNDTEGLPTWRTVRDAVEDLPPPVGTQIRDEPGPLDLHFGRNPTAKSEKRYRAIPEEGMNRFDLEERAPEITPDCWKRKKSGGTDLFGRLWWDKPAFTMRTEFFKPEKGRFLHPVQHRAITHREAARFQSFPDSFEFKGSKIEIARQIGNAVPPLLARRIAESAYAVLSDQTEREATRV